MSEQRLGTCQSCGSGLSGVCRRPSGNGSVCISRTSCFQLLWQSNRGVCKCGIAPRGCSSQFRVRHLSHLFLEVLLEAGSAVASFFKDAFEKCLNGVFASIGFDRL